MIKNPTLDNLKTEIVSKKICEILGETYDCEHWNDWRWQIRHRFTKLEQFEQLLRLTPTEKRGLSIAPEKFAVAVTPYFASLLDPENPFCPLRLQVIPREE
jgi:lysine 2,3-aminomutase